MLISGISPRNADAFNMGNAASDLDDVEDDDYSPTPVYKVVRATRSKMWNPKVTMDGN